MAYSFEGRIRFSEVGENGCLTLPGILNYFQDCSTFQSEELGIGIGALKDKNRVWVLSSWQVVINRYPAMGERVRTSTWPYDFRLFIGSRNFTMDAVSGEHLAWANSIWSYLDIEKGKPARLDEEDLRKYQKEDPLPMEYASRKIVIPGEAEKREPFLIQKHHMDINHHVNNCQYISMAADFLPKGFRIHEMRAEYKKQVFLGERLFPDVATEDRKVTVILRNEAQAVCTVVQFLEEN